MKLLCGRAAEVWALLHADASTLRFEHEPDRGGDVAIGSVRARALGVELLTASDAARQAQPAFEVGGLTEMAEWWETTTTAHRGIGWVGPPHPAGQLPEPTHVIPTGWVVALGEIVGAQRDGDSHLWQLDGVRPVVPIRLRNPRLGLSRLGLEARLQLRGA